MAFSGQSGLSQSTPQKVVIISAAEIAKSWIGKKLPDFAFQDLAGNNVNNNSIKGKVTVLNLWSTTCLPCIYEMSSLNELVAKYSKRDIIFLAPAPEAADKIKAIFIHQPFTYTIIPEAQDLFKSMNLLGYPYHIVVDGEGLIRFMCFGTMNPKTGQKIAESDLPVAIEQMIR